MSMLLTIILLCDYIVGMETLVENKAMPSILIRDVEVELRKRFKMICLQKEVSMNSLLKEIIQRYVDEYEKRDKAK